MNEEETHRTETHDRYTDVYVSILKQYKKQIDNSVTNKNGLKNQFFYLIEGIMLGLLVLFATCVLSAFSLFDDMVQLNTGSIATITGAITAVISSFVTMLLAIIKLPKIIAQYLFNKKEDELMNQIIRNIQKYEIKAVNIDKTALLQNTIRDNDNEIGIKNEVQKEPSNKIILSDISSSPGTSGKMPTDGSKSKKTKE